MAQLLNGGDFEYQNPDQRHEQWRAQILDNQPRPGEARSYGTERDATTEALKADYSLITIAPGVVPGRTIAILGGLDTKGTGGAMVFATSQFGVQKLNAILGDGMKSEKDTLPPFQALVRVNLAKGCQVIGTDLIAVHPCLQASRARIYRPLRARFSHLLSTYFASHGLRTNFVLRLVCVARIVFAGTAVDNCPT